MKIAYRMYPLPKGTVYSEDDIPDLKSGRIDSGILQPALCSFKQSELVIIFPFIPFFVSGFLVIIPVFFVLGIPSSD